MNLTLMKYVLLEYIRSLYYFLSSSPIYKRWKMARLIAHNQCVLEYQQRLGVKPLIAPLAAAQEIENQEVVEDA